MYTRCPKCRTTFAVTSDQLAARGGVVRCGNCNKVFRADQQLMKSIPHTRPVEIKHENTPAPAKVTKPVKTVSNRPLPTLEELLWGRKRSRIKPIFWGAGTLLGFMALALQITYFYSSELGRDPDLRQHVLLVCKTLGCVIQPQVDAGLIELTKTRVSPHPKYANVLRLRATLINRASFSQAYPLMEISLSNRHGVIVGRRTYRPEQYLRKKKNALQNMVPNVIVHAKLELTSPNRRADGYEIRLLADPKIQLSR
ncbi:MAG: DUF3426 domain-containing protein [Acidiferrobacterales bacterium]